MSQIHWRNMQISKLVQQNESLRKTALRHQQIQSYVQRLLDKLQHLQSDNHSYASSNSVLTQHLAHAQELSLSLKQQNESLRQELAQLMHHNACDRAELTKLLGAERSRSTHATQLMHTNKEKEAVIARIQQEKIEMESRILALGRNIQESSIIQGELQKDKAEMKSIIRDKNCKIQEISHLTAKIQADHRRIVEYNEEIQQKFEAREVRLNNLLISMQESNEILNRQMKNSQEKGKILMIKNVQNENTIQKMKQEYEEMKINYQKLGNRQKKLEINYGILDKQHCGIKQLNQRLENEVEKTIRDIKQIKEKNDQLSEEIESVEKLLKQSNEENILLREKIKEIDAFLLESIAKNKMEFEEILNQRDKYQSRWKEKQQQSTRQLLQIKDLLNIVSQLQKQLQQSQSSVLKYKNIFTETEYSLNEYKMKCEQLQELNKTQSVSLTQQKKIRNEIQDEIRILIKQHTKIQHQYHQILRQVKNPRQANRQFDERIGQILKNHREERENAQQMHTKQKRKIKQLYQFELKQRQIEYNRKLILFQQQMRSMINPKM